MSINHSTAALTRGGVRVGQHGRQVLHQPGTGHGTGPYLFLLNSFLTFHSVPGVLKPRTPKWFANPFASGPPEFLSELSTMTRPPRVALHSMACSFTDLRKAGKDPDAVKG